MEIKVLLHKWKLIADIFLNMGKPYRLGIEDYYLGSSDKRYLHHYYFDTFDQAKSFVLNFHDEYYLIRLFKQDHMKEIACNLITSELITPEVKAGFHYTNDQYGFLDIPVCSGKGWYFRGKNLHHPDFVSITGGLNFLAQEAFQRFLKSYGIRNQRTIIKELFAERYPNSAEHYRKNFERYYHQWLEVETQKEEEHLKSLTIRK